MPAHIARFTQQGTGQEGNMEQEMDLKNITITDAFWASRQKLVTEVVIPYQEAILRDAVPGL